MLSRKVDAILMAIRSLASRQSLHLQGKLKEKGANAHRKDGDERQNIYECTHTHTHALRKVRTLSCAKFTAIPTKVLGYINYFPF